MEKEMLSEKETEKKENEAKRLKTTLRNYYTIKYEVDRLDKRISELEEAQKNRNYWDRGMYPRDISKKLSILKTEKVFAQETLNEVENLVHEIKRICGEEGYQLFKTKYIDYKSGEQTARELATSKRAVYAKIDFYLKHVLSGKDIAKGETPWKSVITSKID